MFEVSIIMPVYNVKEHLARAIESALNQKEILTEIILVNDGSTDGCAEICDDYAEREPLLIKVIHQENKGSGPARNTGLDQAIGKYIYFADPDDYFDNTLLQSNLRLAKETKPEMVVFGYTQEKASDPSEREVKRPNFPQLTSQEDFRRHFGNVYQFSPYALWNKLYKRKFLNKHHIRFTSQKTGQDALFNIEVYKHLSSVAVNRQAYYHYVSHEGSSVNRYRPERYLMEQNIAQAFEQLMSEWGEEGTFTDLIGEEYFHALYLETANLVHKDCPLSDEEKVKRLRDIWRTIGTTKIGPYKQGDHNPFRNLLLKTYKQENFSQALFLMKSRNQVAERYTKVFSTVRTFFKN
ncbi:Glycosyltransferase involved in cell wall bisynthesis [Alkalibacterium subtropicum]|uniref:Glycosyltransferase involved in cell wall bisynthesis n=1 Tax=Alkalibacterium subtropicum TaxID=753702 RepID=A0A1I1GHZ8_9LACT|nr:glycosyltransferase [Alkalibacterium subtropicum]SFC11407.1 Glycosyltransferase involved in cell wall bisynthesis [Alkalibacterium subtropicum]